MAHLRPAAKTRERLILRAEPQAWSAAEWSEAAGSREEAQETGRCHGDGHGFYEWAFPVDGGDLDGCTAIRALCEASSHRPGCPQTDSFAHPAELSISLNGQEIYHGELPNHPHDSRGALSYLREQKGAYGYLAHAVLEGPALQQLLQQDDASSLRLRCSCPAGPRPGGLTIYGGDSGRYPIPPTLILEKAVS